MSVEKGGKKRVFSRLEIRRKAYDKMPTPPRSDGFNKRGVEGYHRPGSNKRTA